MPGDGLRHAWERRGRQSKKGNREFSLLPHSRGKAALRTEAVRAPWLESFEAKPGQTLRPAVGIHMHNP